MSADDYLVSISTSILYPEQGTLPLIWKIRPEWQTVVLDVTQSE
jgi:hypothetical protein